MDDYLLAPVNPTAFCAVDDPNHAGDVSSPLTSGGDKRASYLTTLRDTLGVGGGVFHQNDDASGGGGRVTPDQHSTGWSMHRSPQSHYIKGSVVNENSSPPPPSRRFSSRGIPTTGLGGGNAHSDEPWSSATAGGLSSFSSRLRLSPPPEYVGPSVSSPVAAINDTSFPEESPGAAGGWGAASSRFSTPVRCRPSGSGAEARSPDGAADGGLASVCWSSPAAMRTPRGQLTRSPLSSDGHFSTGGGSHLGSPPPLVMPTRSSGPLSGMHSLHATPSKTFRTPVQGSRNLLFPSTGASTLSELPLGFDTQQRVPLRRLPTPFHVPATALHKSPSSRARRPDQLTAIRVLDGLGLSLHPLTKSTVTYCANGHLLAALQNVVFRWSADGLLQLLLEAPCEVAAVAASSSAAVTQYAAVGLKDGLIHLFELDTNGTVTRSYLYNQLQSRITCMAFCDNLFYCGTEDGMFLVLDLHRRRSSGVAQRGGGGSNNSNSGVTGVHHNTSTNSSSSSSQSQLGTAATTSSSSSGSSALVEDDAVLERCCLGHTIFDLDVTEDGNHVALGTAGGVFVAHRSQLTPVPLLLNSHSPRGVDGDERLEATAPHENGPVFTVSWASTAVGLGLLVFAEGSVLTLYSLNGGIKGQKDTGAEIVTLKCTRSSADVVVSHGRRVDTLDTHSGGGAGVSAGLDASDGSSGSGIANSVVVYDMSGFKVRLGCRLAGHTAEVRCLCFDPTGHTVVTAAPDDSIRFWDLRRYLGVSLFSSAAGGGVVLGSGSVPPMAESDGIAGSCGGPVSKCLFGVHGASSLFGRPTERGLLDDDAVLR